MKTLTDQLAQYAADHRNRRNIATHCVGVPMIVLAVTVLLSRLALGHPLLMPAMVAAVAATLSHLRLDVRDGALLGLRVGPVRDGHAPLRAWRL